LVSFIENLSGRHWEKGYEVREKVNKKFVYRFKGFFLINFKDFCKKLGDFLRMFLECDLEERNDLFYIIRVL